MNTWMASLTGDPGMAALLEPIVAPPLVSKPPYSPLCRSSCNLITCMGSRPSNRNLAVVLHMWTGILARDGAQQCTVSPPVDAFLLPVIAATYLSSSVL